jgi:murein DD-endopeptidase MepM/ murein hydrolase activator NlpD
MPARGRHRRHRPSTVSRASLRVTAGGAGIAIPLIGAHFAYAGPEDVWQKVAACESGGKWDTNTGNGFYGGLQFTQNTWQSYGGTAYAPRADLAERGEQVTVAQKVLAGQGPMAWPNCGPRTGLSRQSGATALSSSRQPASADRAAAQARADRERAERDARERKAERAQRAREERTKKPTTYEVVGGDSLSSIADAHEVEGGWQGLYAHNRATVGRDPDLILPGQSLHFDAGAHQARPAPHKPAPHKPAPHEPAAHKAAPHKPTPRTPARPQPRPHKSAPPRPAPHRAEPKPAAKSSSASATSVTAPVSGFSPTTAYRSSGGSWSSGHHTGVDFPVPTGTAVKAIRGGEVVSAGWGGAYGYQVVLRHSDGKYSQYGHLSAISVRAGQSVGTGQRIARSGATGNATGPHLHFEVRTGPGYGTDVNPLSYLSAHGVRV